MFQKKILWLIDWQGWQKDFTKVSENSEFKWEAITEWQAAAQKMRWAKEQDSPFGVAFVDSFEKAEWVWKNDPSIQCVIWADYDQNWAQNFNKFHHWDNWVAMKKPFTQWEAWQAAKALWKKWEAEQGFFGQEDSSKVKKILVVDDENPIREMVSDMLNDAGFKVFVASNGEEALKLFDDPNFKVDLLLTDIVMPKVTGIRLAETVGRNHPSVPVLFMSGFPRDTQFQQDCESGQKRFIQKPFSSDILVRTVQDAFTTGFWSSGQWKPTAAWDA